MSSALKPDPVEDHPKKGRDLMQRRLGESGPEVSAIGLGAMGMSESYGTPDGAACVATLERAVELGVTFWDTADAYGSGHNEELIGGFIAERGWRDRIVLATKFGFVREGGRAVGISGKPEYVRGACDASLRRLGFDCIDLYYQHRIDTEVPVEESLGAMSELVQAGKVKALGLSEVSADTLRPRPRSAPDRGGAAGILPVESRPGARGRHPRRQRRRRRRPPRCEGSPALDEAMPRAAASGERYGAIGMALADR